MTAAAIFENIDYMKVGSDTFVIDYIKKYPILRQVFPQPLLSVVMYL